MLFLPPHNHSETAPPGNTTPLTLLYLCKGWWFLIGVFQGYFFLLGFYLWFFQEVVGQQSPKIFILFLFHPAPSLPCMLKSRPVLKAWLDVLGEFGGVLYTDEVRFYPCHPMYIDHLPMLQYIQSERHRNHGTPEQSCKSIVTSHEGMYFSPRQLLNIYHTWYQVIMAYYFTWGTGGWWGRW